VGGGYIAQESVTMMIKLARSLCVERVGARYIGRRDKQRGQKVKSTFVINPAKPYGGTDILAAKNTKTGKMDSQHIDRFC